MPCSRAQELWDLDTGNAMSARAWSLEARSTKEGVADLGFLGAMYQSICALGLGYWECYVGACFFLGGCVGIFYILEKLSGQKDAGSLHVMYSGTQRAKA